MKHSQRQPNAATNTPARAAALKARLQAIATTPRESFKDESPAGVAVDRLQRVFYRAAAGNKKATRELIRIATLAAELTERLYYRRPQSVKEAARGAAAYPTLYTLDESAARRRQEILQELKLRETPFKSRKRSDNDYVYQFITEVAYPMLEELRLQGIGIKSRDGTVNSIPPLHRKTAKRWAALAADYFSPVLAAASVEKEAWAATVGGIQRKVGQKNYRMLDRMASRLGVSNIVSASAARALIDSMCFQGDITPIRATREHLRLRKLTSREGTQADWDRGLRETISVKLASLLKK